METRKENTALGTVTLKQDEAYNPDNQLCYHTSLSLLERLLKRSIISASDYSVARDILREKYNLPNNSIFAENA